MSVHSIGHGRLDSGLAFFFLAGLVFTVLSSDGNAATRVDKQRRAEQLVQEALAHESLGLSEDRHRLLNEALDAAPEFAPANWHQGRVKIGQNWLSVEEAIETENQQKLRQSYERQRETAPDTVPGQLALADWCAAHCMVAQETAHLNRVIQLEPNHVEARNRLNQRQVNGRWVQQKDLWKGLQDRQLVQESVAKWQDRLLRVAGGLDDRGSARSDAARRKLVADLDVDAAPAIESILATHSQPAALLAVELLGEMPEHQASQALVRIAVLSPWADVRDQAASQLQTRPYDHYVPLLLSELATPIDSRIDAALVGGRILYRHVFEQELMDRRQVAMLDTVLMRRGSLVQTNPAGPLDEGPFVDPMVSLQALSAAEAETRARALTDMQRVMFQREQVRLQRNLWIYSMNERIGEVLRTATGQNLPPAPQAWWSWWDEENGVRMDGEKFTDIRYNQDVEVYEDIDAVVVTGGDSTGGSSPAPRRCECFVAGTPVWTITGPMPIERVRIGDLVLSQDPNSGELAYKPVLQTTVRPAEALIKVTLATRDREILEGSSGHPLWVAGEGWTMLRELDSGDLLHGIGGSAVVSEVVEGQTAETFNLVIDDFHTYVVGDAKIVCHDNTPRRPTNAVVPGLIPK